MIFVSVGAQGPFDRLIRAVDDWAHLRTRSDVFAQIGESNYRAKYIETTRYLDSLQFQKKVQESNLIVAHAGMGTIITALEFGKPIIVMPRRGDLRETRNDHQIATTKKLEQQGRVIAAFDIKQLHEKLDETASLGGTALRTILVTPKLISVIQKFIDGTQ